MTSLARKRKSHLRSRARSRFQHNPWTTTCEVCNNDVRLELHHVVPVAQGGSARAENLVLLCRICHRSVVHGKGRRGKAGKLWPTTKREFIAAVLAERAERRMGNPKGTRAALSAASAGERGKG